MHINFNSKVTAILRLKQKGNNKKKSQLLTKHKYSPQITGT